MSRHESDPKRNQPGAAVNPNVSPTPGPQNAGIPDPMGFPSAGASIQQPYDPQAPASASSPWTDPTFNVPNLNPMEASATAGGAGGGAPLGPPVAAPGAPPITGAFPGALPQLVEGPASQIYNMNQAQQFGQQNQDQLTQMLTQAALGLGPSAAQSNMQMQNDRMLQQMQTQGTLGGALGVSQAQMAAPMQNAQALQQMGVQSAQEQQFAMGALGENIAQGRTQDLAQAEAAATWIQQSNEFNNMVTEQMAKGWQDASGAAVDQTKIALMIQNAIQQRGQFLTNADIRILLAEAGMTPTAGETSTFSDVAGVGVGAAKVVAPLV